MNAEGMEAPLGVVVRCSLRVQRFFPHQAPALLKSEWMINLPRVTLLNITKH
jgi:hypothetical protein